MSSLALFAQQFIEFHQGEHVEPWIAGAIGLAVIVSLTWAVFAWRGARAAEAERAKILDMGYLPPPRSSRWPQALYCTAVGLGVPLATVALRPHDDSFASFFVPLLVSAIALVGSTIVAAISFARPDRSSQSPYQPISPVKPAAGPEAFDFAGRVNGR